MNRRSIHLILQLIFCNFNKTFKIKMKGLKEKEPRDDQNYDDNHQVQFEEKLNRSSMRMLFKKCTGENTEC